jgi:hypothetical protein
MKTLLWTALLVGALGLLGIACGDNGNNGNDAGPADMTMPEKPDLLMMMQPDMAPACTTNPMTHVEIINACTDADSYDKMPYFPMLAPNGQLPPLP